jgi:hypothetical protein
LGGLGKAALLIVVRLFVNRFSESCPQVFLVVSIVLLLEKLKGRLFLLRATWPYGSGDFEPRMNDDSMGEVAFTRAFAEIQVEH